MTRSLLTRLVCLAFALGMAGVSVTACNTVEGAGRGVAKDARAVKKKL